MPGDIVTSIFNVVVASRFSKVNDDTNTARYVVLLALACLTLLKMRRYDNKARRSDQRLVGAQIEVHG